MTVCGPRRAYEADQPWGCRAGGGGVGGGTERSQAGGARGGEGGKQDGSLSGGSVDGAACLHRTTKPLGRRVGASPPVLGYFG